jgi:CheY-like chemotaxis protein
MSRILVVDDDQDLRELYMELLKEQGHVVMGAADGAAGLELASALKPDLILTDWRMPRMDGVELCKELRRHVQLRGTRIILHSSEGTPVSRHADVCMPKISDPEAFMLVIEATLTASNTDEVAS